MWGGGRGGWTQCQREAVTQLGWNEGTQDTGELLSWEGMKHPFTLITAHRLQLRPHKATWTRFLPPPRPPIPVRVYLMPSSGHMQTLGSDVQKYPKPTQHPGIPTPSHLSGTPDPGLCP